MIGREVFSLWLIGWSGSVMRLDSAPQSTHAFCNDEHGGVLVFLGGPKSQIECGFLIGCSLWMYAGITVLVQLNFPGWEHSNLVWESNKVLAHFLRSLNIIEHHWEQIKYTIWAEPWGGNLSSQSSLLKFVSTNSSYFWGHRRFFLKHRWNIHTYMYVFCLAFILLWSFWVPKTGSFGKAAGPILV